MSIVETGKMLFTQANMALEFWTYSFQTATFLLNRLPCKPLNNSTPYEAFFNQEPNYENK